MHTTITTLAVSDDAKHIKKFWTHTATLRRRYPNSELTMLPIEHLDDPNNSISIWSNVQAADIVICLISEEFLAALDDLTDPANNNLIRDELLSKRHDPQFRLVPVILSNCSWDSGTVFARLQSMPWRKTIKQMDADTAWCEVAQGVEQVMKSLQNLSQAPAAQPQGVSKAQTSKQTTQISPLFCRRCGDPLPANASYCQCGASVSSTQQPVSAFVSAYVSQQPQVPISARPANKSILLVYSTQDKALAQEGIKILKSYGLPIVDSQDFPPGSQWRDVLRDRVRQASSVVFLLSSDFMAEYQSNDHYNVVALTRMALSSSLLASSYAVVIRYCAYDCAFTGVQPHIILSVDSKPIGASKKKEESWFALGRHLCDQVV